MQSRAAQTLAKAYRTRGAQRDHAKRTGIPQGTLSRLAKVQLGSEPTGETIRKLHADPELPIDPAWWLEPALPDAASDKGAA